MASIGLHYCQALPREMISCNERRDCSTKGTRDGFTPAAGKRKLLLIYIHGFCGSEQSFGQLPLHVHDSVRQGLPETHALYSMIYPQYETRHAMHIAVERFSRWLQRYETSQTDIILIGHSLGGILAAEVALLVGQLSATRNLDN